MTDSSLVLRVNGVARAEIRVTAATAVVGVFWQRSPGGEPLVTVSARRTDRERSDDVTLELSEKDDIEIELMRNGTSR